MTTKTRKPGELVFNGILVIISLFFVYQSYQISGLTTWSAPGFFPLLAASIMLISAMVSLITTAQIQAPVAPIIAFWRQVLPRQIIIMLVCVLVFALALDKIGFLPAAFLFLFITLNLFYRRGWHRSFIIALIALTIIYLIFRGVFLVILPEGEWTTSFTQMISSIQISFIK